jgi:hypothetical protein
MVQEICFIEVDKRCWNSATKIRGKLTISNFLPWFEMETPETLNTKHVDILLNFPMNICVSHADKPRNGYGHWEIARCEIFDGKLAADWAFEDGRRFSSGTELR